MKVFNNRVIVSQEKRINDTVKVGVVDFILDNVFRGAWNTIQKATVVAAGESSGLVSGDEVYVHHFVSEKENQLPFKDKTMSWLEYNHIFARILKNGDIYMLNNYLFVEPIRFDNSRFLNDSNGFIMTDKSGGEFVERMGFAKHLSKTCIEAGLKEGDAILFNKNCEYQIEVDGKKLYRMELRDVITVVPDDIQVTAIKA